MQAIWYALSFCLGAGVGSFINMLVYRLRPEAPVESIRGRSYCDSCKKQLRWYELIPVLSFVVQKGRCRRCRAELPVQYPVVEFVTGLIFLLLVWRLSRVFPMPLGTAAWWWGIGLIVVWWIIALVMMAISAYDTKYYLIPDIFLYSLIGLGIFLNGYYWLLSKYVGAFPQSGLVFSDAFGYFVGRTGFSWWFVMWGVLFCVGVIGVAYLLSRGRAMGFGDVLLAIGLGLVLGWPDAMVGMLLGFVSGTIVSIGLIWSKKKTMKDIVPFGPFLVFGAFLAVLFSGTIIQGYFAFFSRIFGL